MEGMQYTTKSMIMRPGDIMFIYSDGVTEAMDPDNKLYSEDRLMEFMTAVKEPFAPKLVKEMDQSIKAFTRGAEQSDDITMLAMQFIGKCEE